jgi:hypothetical protein
MSDATASVGLGGGACAYASVSAIDGGQPHQGNGAAAPNGGGGCAGTNWTPPPETTVKQQCHIKAANARFVDNGGGFGGIGGGATMAAVDWEDPRIKEEVLRMIAAYLQGEGYVASSMMLMDEANLRRSDVKKAQQEQQQWSKKVKKAILEGDWAEVGTLCVQHERSIKSIKRSIKSINKFAKP